MKLEDRESEHGSRRVRREEKDGLAALSRTHMALSELNPNKPAK